MPRQVRVDITALSVGDSVPSPLAGEGQGEGGSGTMHEKM